MLVEIWWIFVMDLFPAHVLPLPYAHMHTHTHTRGREANCELHWVLYSYVPSKCTPMWSTHMYI